MENEEKYKAIKKEILDEGDSDSNTDQEAGRGEEEEEVEDEEKDKEEGGRRRRKDEEEGGGGAVWKQDKTEFDLVAFCPTISLAIQLSLGFEEEKM